MGETTMMLLLAVLVLVAACAGGIPAGLWALATIIWGAPGFVIGLILWILSGPIAIALRYGSQIKDPYFWGHNNDYEDYRFYDWTEIVCGPHTMWRTIEGLYVFDEDAGWRRAYVAEGFDWRSIGFAFPTKRGFNRCRESVLFPC